MFLSLVGGCSAGTPLLPAFVLILYHFLNKMEVVLPPAPHPSPLLGSSFLFLPGRPNDSRSPDLLALALRPGVAVWRSRLSPVPRLPLPAVPLQSASAPPACASINRLGWLLMRGGRGSCLLAFWWFFRLGPSRLICLSCRSVGGAVVFQGFSLVCPRRNKFSSWNETVSGSPSGDAGHCPGIAVW